MWWTFPSLLEVPKNGAAELRPQQMPDRMAEPVRLLTSRVLAAGEVPPSVLHVQSISDWAPACIGPYAQAVAARGLLHMAGQIPLEPGSMQIEGQGLIAQARAPLCYRSCAGICGV